MSADGPREPDVHLTNGITISLAAAVAVVGIIDELAVLCAPKRLGEWTVALRHQLMQCCTDANASERVSAKVVAEQDLLEFQLGAVVDTGAAAERLGITGAGVRYLCRAERLVWTRDSGGRYWIDQNSVDSYIQERGR